MLIIYKNNNKLNLCNFGGSSSFFKFLRLRFLVVNFDDDETLSDDIESNDESLSDDDVDSISDGGAGGFFGEFGTDIESESIIDIGFFVKFGTDFLDIKQ